MNTGIDLELPIAGFDYAPDEVEFMGRAACRDYSPQYWDTDTRRGRTTFGKPVEINGRKVSRRTAIGFAKQVCRGCPVRLECLTFVTKHPQGEGVWAGLLPEERRRHALRGAAR